MSVNSDPSETRRATTPLAEGGRTHRDPDENKSQRALRLLKPGVGDGGSIESRAGIRLRTPVPPQPLEFCFYLV